LIRFFPQNGSDCGSRVTHKTKGQPQLPFYLIHNAY